MLTLKPKKSLKFVLDLNELQMSKDQPIWILFLNIFYSGSQVNGTTRIFRKFWILHRVGFDICTWNVTNVQAFVFVKCYGIQNSHKIFEKYSKRFGI